MFKAFACFIGIEAVLVCSLAVSDSAWTGFFTTVGLLITTGGGIALAYIQLRSLRVTKEAVAAVKQVKEDVACVKETADKTLEVGEKTHALTNSAMLEQKRIYMVKCEAMAEKTADSVDIAEAAAAKEVYEEHRAAQEKLDADTKAKLAAKSK